MIIEVPFIPPTINTAYGRNKQGRRYLSEAGKQYKSIVKARCFKWRSHVIQVPYELEIEIHKPWYTKKGTIRKEDISNRIKIAEDALMEGLGLDDCFIFKVSAKKVESTLLRTVFSLSPMAPLPLAESPEC